MPIALTCDCGARFEIDDSYAGQEWPCPDCSAPIRAPRKANASARPGLLALLAAALALAGAFTIVGSLAAAILGAVALIRIRASKGQLAGQRFALAALVGGLILTGLTVFLWTRPGLFPIGLWLRRQQFAGQLETGGPLEAVGPDGSLTRPSAAWSRAVRGRTTHPVLGDMQKGRDLLFVHLDEYAFADMARLDVPGNSAYLEMEPAITQDMLPERPGLFGPDDDRRRVPSQLAMKQSSRLGEAVDGWKCNEWLFDVTRGGQRWRFIVRAYRKERPAASDPVYIVRAYCPARSFARLEPELRQILDSLRIGKR